MRSSALGSAPMLADQGRADVMLVLPRARRVRGWRTCWTFSERGRILGYPSYLSEYLIRIVDVVVESKRRI